MMREELLNKLKAKGDLNLYLKLKDKSNEIIMAYVEVKPEPKKSKKKSDEGTIDTADNSIEE
jgi:hypothetical protein